MRSSLEPQPLGIVTERTNLVVRNVRKSLLRKPNKLQSFILAEELPEFVLRLRSNIVELARSLGNIEGIDSPEGLDHSSLLADGILEDLKECGLLRSLDIRLLAEHSIGNQHRGEVVEVVECGRLHHRFSP